MPLICRVCLLAALFSMTVAGPAFAQSFLEKLFGIGTSKEEHTQLPPPMPSYRAPIHMPQPRVFSRSDAESLPQASGTVRTVCVRTCDGYYFPISNSTSARNLTADNARCKAACGGSSRLFYSSETGEPHMASMVDLSGRRYDELDTAFAYRKALRPGCSCRPPPWSSAERLRHFKYALEEAQREMATVTASDVGFGSEPNSFSHHAGSAGDDAGREIEVVAADAPARVANSDDQHLVHAPSVTPVRREDAASPQPREDQRQAVHNPRPAVAPSPVSAARDRYSNADSSPGMGLGSLFGFGKQQKYVWPGDVR